MEVDMDVEVKLTVYERNGHENYGVTEHVVLRSHSIGSRVVLELDGEARTVSLDALARAVAAVRQAKN